MEYRTLASLRGQDYIRTGNYVGRDFAVNISHGESISINNVISIVYTRTRLKNRIAYQLGELLCGYLPTLGGHRSNILQPAEVP